jgi:hypothetical protein
MKKTHLFFFSLLFLLTILFGNSSFGQASNPKTLLCNAGWKKTEWTVTPAMQYKPQWPVASNLLQLERECSKDDYYVFATDGTYQLLNGINKCSDAEADLISNGKWAFQIYDNRIFSLVPKGTGGILQKRIELSSDKMVWTTYKTINGVKYTFREAFSPL